MNIKISVCIPTYNGGKYIKAQLESILNQLSANDEVIISDDSSNDDTISIAEAFNDNRIIILKKNKFKSPIFNTENALKASKGEIIFLADQDDVWVHNKVSICLKALKMSDLVVSDCYVADEYLNITAQSFFSVNKAKLNRWGGLIKRNPYLGCCMAFKRDVLCKSLPFPKNIPMHDIWIGNVAAFFFKVSFIRDKLIYYRRHVENVTPTAGISSFSFTEKINYRFKIIVNLIKLIRS